LHLSLVFLQAYSLIIGSARGIGQGVALAFAKAGASIASFDLRGTSETVELAEKEGVKAKGWELDASNEKAVGAAIDEVEKELGPIAILVNCAGIVGSRPVMMEYYSNFWKTMEVNTGAVYPFQTSLI
jgi:NAD(P)-dependent dehydrogenase (short-subunit alcohol dehydrogenase family)